MPGPDEFDRLRDLLGDVCEGAAAPAPETDDADQARGRGRRPTAYKRPAGADRAAETPSKPRDTARILARVWPEVVGADVAANTAPVQLARGRLVVSTSSSVWAQTLQFMTEDIIVGLNARMGPGTVQQVVFRHAGWEERPPAAGSTQAPERPLATSSKGKLSSEQKKAIEDVENLDLPPDIKDRIARAMKAAFVRGEQGSVR